MASKVLALTAQAQDSLFSSAFAFSAGDDLILSRSTAAVTYTLQRRSNTGSNDWVDTAVTGTLSTTVNTEIPASSLMTLLGAGYLFRIRLSAAARLWVAVDPGTVERESGTVTAPVLAPPASNQFTPVIWPPPAADGFSGLAANSVVFIFMGGQSNWEGGGPNAFTGVWPTKSKFWDGTQLKIINSANGFRSQANPTVFLAKAFESAYPNLELWIAEDGEGGSGFHDNKWETGGALRARFLAKVSSAYTYALTQNRNIFFGGLHWNQGEADAYNPYAAVYGTALAGFVTAMRAVSRTDAPFVPVRISINQILFDQRETVRAVQASYPIWTNIDAIPLHTDNVHYTEAGYQAIGQAQFASLERTSITRIKTYVAPTNDVYSFRGLSALPVGFTSTLLGTPGYLPTYTELNRGASNAWSTTYVTSPVLDWATYDVLITFIAAGLNGVGLSDNYSTGLFSGGENLIAVQNGGVFYKGNNLADLGAWVAGKTYTLKFVKTGTNVVLTLTNITDNTAPTTATITDVGLTAPRATMDSAFSDFKIVEVAEVVK